MDFQLNYSNNHLSVYFIQTSGVISKYYNQVSGNLEF